MRDLGKQYFPFNPNTMVFFIHSNFMVFSVHIKTSLQAYNVKLWINGKTEDINCLRHDAMSDGKQLLVIQMGLQPPKCL